MRRGFVIVCLVAMVALWGGLVTIYDDAGRAHVLQVSETGGVGRAWMVHDMTTGRSWMVESDVLADPPGGGYTGSYDAYGQPAPRRDLRKDFPDLFFVDGF